MAMRVQRHANVSKQAKLLDGLDVSPLKWRVCACGLNRFVHEGLDHILNVEVHLKTRSGNVNILGVTSTCSNTCMTPVGHTREGIYVEVTPDIDLDSILFYCKIQKSN